MHRSTETVSSTEPHGWRMVDPVPAGPERPDAGEAGTERAIRFAVYLTGGLVTLAFGVLEVASSLGQLLSCLFQTEFCPGGFTSGLYLGALPSLGGGALLVVVASVLFVLAHHLR